MTDFARIKSNVELMASKGAPPDKIRGYIHSEGMTTHQFKARLEGMSEGGIADTALKYSAGSGVANLLDMPGRGVTAAGNLVRMGAGVAGHKLGILDEPLSVMPPDSLDVATPGFKKLGLINDAYAPTTAGGKVVDFTTQAITGGGVNPAAVSRNASRGMVKPIVRDFAAATLSGAGAGVGNVLTENIDTGSQLFNDIIKTVGTVGGGMVPGGAIAARGTGGDRAAAALQGVTKEQLALAKALQDKALSGGVPLTGYEAIQGITGLNPKMQTQQRVAEQSDAAAKTLTPMMQQRPQNNSAMFERTTGGIAPKEQFPDTLAGELQSTAQNAITNARQQGNAAATPFYQATSNNPANKVPSNTWNMLASDDGVMAALQAVKKDPYADLQGAPEGSLSWLDQAKKHLDSQIEVASRTGDNFAAKQMAAARDKIVSAADAAFPDYARARGIVAANMRDNVIPMEQSQVGKLSRSDDFKQQSEALLPNAPADVTPEVVGRTADTIGAQDPKILARFLAQDLRRKFTESNQALQGGEPTGGGAKFAANVAGNETQQANLIAALKATGQDTVPFETTLDIFKAQGYKPPVNSATTANAAESSALGTNALDMFMGRLRPKIDNWRNGMATSDLTKALVAPDSVQRLEELARINGVHDPMKQQMLINLLLGNQAAQ